MRGSPSGLELANQRRKDGMLKLGSGMDLADIDCQLSLKFLFLQFGISPKADKMPFVPETSVRTCAHLFSCPLGPSA